MSYVLQASPLTKMFLPEWEQRCVANPELINSPVPFIVTVPRPSGAIVMEHGKPRHASSLIPNTGLRRIDKDESRDLVMWLTDSMSGETDQWGVVELNIDMTVHQSINNMLSIPELLSEDKEVREKAFREQMDQQGRLMKVMRDAVASARERANERVKKQLKITHHNLIKQWESNTAQGGGQYPPSATEAMGAFILSQEIKAANSAKQALVDNMRDVMNQTRVG